MRKALLVALLVLLTCVPVQAQTTASVYVSPDGDDANPGTLTAPVQTIAQAANMIPDGGEIVLRGGVYPENIYRVLPSNSTLKSFKGERAVIRPGSGNWALHISYSVENVTVQGVEIDATGTLYDAVKVTTYAKNIRLIDCDIHGSVSHGVLVSDHAENVSIIGGRVHDNGVSDSRHGIYFSAIDGGLVDGVEIYNNKGHAVHVYGGGNGYHNTVRGNYIHDNGAGVGAYYGTVDIENNTITNSGNYLIRLQYALESAVVSDNDLSYPNPTWTSIYVANLTTENALVTVRGNYIHDSYLGVWVRNPSAEGAKLIIQSNVFENSNTPVLVKPTTIEVKQDDNIRQ